MYPFQHLPTLWLIGVAFPGRTYRMKLEVGINWVGRRKTSFLGTAHRQSGWLENRTAVARRQVVEMASGRTLGDPEQSSLIVDR